MNHEDVRSFVESYRNFIGDWHEKVAALLMEQCVYVCTAMYAQSLA